MRKTNRYFIIPTDPKAAHKSTAANDLSLYTQQVASGLVTVFDCQTNQYLALNSKGIPEWQAVPIRKCA